MSITLKNLTSKNHTNPKLLNGSVDWLFYVVVTGECYFIARRMQERSVRRVLMEAGLRAELSSSSGGSTCWSISRLYKKRLLKGWTSSKGSLMVCQRVSEGWIYVLLFFMRWFVLWECFMYTITIYWLLNTVPFSVLENWLDCTGELEPPEPLDRLPELKHSIKQLLNEMGKVQQIALICAT